MIDEKRELRTNFLRMRKALSKESVENKSYRVIKKLQKLVNSQISTIMFYVPINNEVDLLPFAKEMFQTGRKILFPKLIGKKWIEPYIVNDLYKDFVKGAYNIPEPATEVYNGIIDLALIPGIAFGRNGYRIGYGKGYFDRFLNSEKIKKIIGVCYDFQLLVSVPHTEYDYQLDIIISENEAVIINK